MPPDLGLPASVIRRDGDAAPFDAEKIRSAIERAGAATGEFGADEAGLLSSQAVKVLAHRFAETDPDIEQIQDVVEQVLISANHFATARAYIVYREQRARLRSDKKTVVEVETSMNEYLDQADWRVNANANQGYSLGGLILNVSGKVVANYWLSHVYPRRGRRGAPRGRRPHPRPRHARRLLRRLVASHAASPRASTACPARSSRRRPSTSRARSARS